MYNLVCFPHYTCGALLCDILNDTWSNLGSNGNILNQAHDLGKIGDSESVFTEFNENILINRKNQWSLPEGTWIGTHCWPSEKLCNEFKQIILVTTSTSRSQIYRWARAYHHFFEPKWTDLGGIERVDKIRETAKNYILPFSPVKQPNVVNLEFAEIVENTITFQHVMQPHPVQHHISRWQHVNSFLYDQNFWNNVAAKSFYQAQYEYELGNYYRYI